MEYASWMQRTKGTFIHRNRSNLLKGVDRALEAWGKDPKQAKMKALQTAFKKWTDSKDAFDKVRNVDGAVDELAELIEAKVGIPDAPALPPSFKNSMRPGPKPPLGNPIEEAAKKARARARKQERDRWTVDVPVTQTITYAPGQTYQKWNPATSSWYAYVVPGPASEDMDYSWTVKLDLILRGMILEVRVQGAAGPAISEKVRQEWTKHILASWNNRAKLADKDNNKTYEIQFNLVWVAPGAHVNSIGLGDTTPTVQKTGAPLITADAPSDVIYLSELRLAALGAPDLAAWKAAKLSGNVTVCRLVGGAWAYDAKPAASQPELADLLKALTGTATFTVKDVKGTGTFGPWAAKDARMRQKILAGLVTAKTEVKKTGSFEWKHAEDFPELRGFLTPEDERKAWENAQNKTVNTAVFGDADRKAICHEFGHLIGCPDEYEVTSLSASTGQTWSNDIHNAVRFTTKSVMNNPGTGLIYDRHFALILKQYREWQKSVRGKPIPAEIVMNTVRQNEGVGHMTVQETLALLLIRQRQGRP